MRVAVGCLLSCLTSLAQAQFLFDHLGVEDGLPCNEVLCVHEDQRGFMWAGTRTGLARLEGTRVRSFFHDRSDSTTLAHDLVNAIGEDANGRLWFATMAGLSLYDPQKGSFRSFRIATEGSAAHLANRMRQVVCVGDTLLWITTQDGLYRFDTRSASFTRAPTDRPGHGPPGEANDPGDLHWDAHRQGMWAGCTMGMAYWDARADVWKDRRNAQEPWFQERNVQVPLLQGNDTLWYFKTDDFLLRGWYMKDGSTWSVDSVGGERNHFGARWQALDPDGRHWISAWTHRLFVSGSDGTWDEVHPSSDAPAALRGAHIAGTCRGRNGDRWFATDQGLAVLLAANEHVAVLQLEGFDNGVSALTLLGEDTLLVGGRGDGLVLLRLSTGEQRHTRVHRALLPEEDRQWSDYIKGFTRDQRGRILASTMGWPLEVDVEKMEVKELPDWLGTTKNGRWIRHTTFLEPDGDHHLWIGTWSRGLFRLDQRDGTRSVTDEHVGPHGPLTDDGVLCFLRDSRGRSWIGLNDGGGTMVLENGKFKAVKEAGGGNLGGVVRCMAEAPDGALWLGTHEEGLIRYDPQTGSEHQFGRRSGLPGVRIGHLFFDGSGTLWVCTDRGIAHLRPGSDEFRVLALPAGLDPESVAGAGLQLPDGRLVFGVGRHLLFLDPRKGHGRSDDLHAAITGFDINGTRSRDALPGARIDVREDGRALSFELAAGGVAPGVVPLFRFRTNTSQAWVALGTSARLDLFDLPVGQHVLQVQASANGVDWSEAYQLPITVTPLLHRTAWFRVLIAALILGALAAIAWLYVQARLRKQRALFEQEQAVLQERVRIAGDMHDDLGAGLSALKLRSEMALRVEKDPVKREQLGSLSRSAGELIGSMRQIIWTMNQDQGSLADLAAYTGNYTRSYCQENGLAAEVAADDRWPDIQLTSEQRRNIFLFVKEALHNVVKHANARTVRLVVRYEADGLIVAVQDDGIGLPKGTDTSVGNGLRNMKKRITALGGTLEHGWPASGSGTLLQAHVPIPNKGSIAAADNAKQLRAE